MHALPFEPFVAFLFGLLPGIEHAHCDPWIFLQNCGFYQQCVHNWEKSGSLEKIPFQLCIVGKKKVDVRVNVGGPGFGGDAGVDLAGGEEIELSTAVWDKLHFEPG